MIPNASGRPCPCKIKERNTEIPAEQLNCNRPVRSPARIISRRTGLPGYGEQVSIIRKTVSIDDHRRERRCVDKRAEKKRDYTYQSQVHAFHGTDHIAVDGERFFHEMG